jgi:transposase-like protein
MPSRYPVEVRRQVVELARSGTRVAETFGMTEASIYSWLSPPRACATATVGCESARVIDRDPLEFRSLH